jgi:hypothetical protein
MQDRDVGALYRDLACRARKVIAGTKDTSTEQV